MVVGNQDAVGANNGAHPSGIPQDQIDNIMRGIANTGDVKMNNHRKKLRQRFDIIKKLGQGTYGKVQLGINKETGQEVAIKTIKKCKIEAEADLVRIRREVQIMSSVQHPNIIHIYEVFENREKMVLVMEFAAGGELYDYLSERKVLNEEEARRIFRQVATAVYYCHKHKICHRDLKLENILLDEHGNAKIADFGLSNVFDEQCLLATFCGSPLYASPEIVEGTPYHGPEVDCWSLGVLLYTLVYGSMPFDGSNFKRLVKQISQGDYYEPKKPSRASSLIREMLTVCPRKRATIEQICSHWWVNETDNVSCLELAEDLANQTPVRLDVLLSLTPVAITAEQLVVPSADGGNSALKNIISRSHSVGSVRDVVPNTEAERRILDMVAAGGEAALMPSPTRTITPAQSPLQTKRKLENTISTDNAIGLALKKKDKTEDNATNLLTEESLPAVATAHVARVPTFVEAKAIPMETEDSSTKEANQSRNFSAKDMEMVDDLCEQLIHDKSETETPQQTENANKDSELVEDSQPEKSTDASKVIKKFVKKHKTADLVNSIGKIDPSEGSANKNQVIPENIVPPSTGAGQKFVRKCSLQDESPLSKFNAERRKSRILETAEKFQQMNASNVNVGDKNKKLIIPGVSVGNFKKEYERKASSNTENQGQQLTPGERRALEQVAAAAAVAAATEESEKTPKNIDDQSAVEASDSKASVSSFSLDEARRSMENSIALLRQAQTESSKDVNQICAKTESIHFGDSPSSKQPPANERERKLINARAIIGNAIQPVSPQPGEASSSATGGMKTSTASITLKSATLPRRKTAKTEIQLDIKPPIAEQPSMRFTTEMQHPIADLRSAPPREGPIPYSPIKAMTSQRATSLEPKEHVITVQRPPSTYTRTISNSTNRSGSLSRQSTNDSESDTTTNMSQATITGSSQPIKKSPREFIIPIAVEGGGFITPREGSIEPSESSQTSATTSSRSTFTRLRPTRRIGSLLSESGVDEGSPFQKLRTSTSIRDGDDDARFTLHKLRSSRPIKKTSQENDSQSSGEEDDDDDGFEILTAENLFSTLLQRVRALTNRMNVNNDISTAFPSSSRLLSNMRQAQSPFWNQEPFSRLNSTAMSAPWRHSMSRDLGSDMDSMFSRTGATLPRGNNSSEIKTNMKNRPLSENVDGPLDLADLDLSRLRLSKKDLETLSNIAPGLPKCFQEQLLAKLPPTQARKLSRTLSVQTNQNCSSVHVYKRSQSSGRNAAPPNEMTNNDDARDQCLKSSVRTTVEKNMDEKAPIKVHHSAVKADSKSKSNADNCKDFRPPQSSDINEKYKYYSPYVNKGLVKDSSQKSTTKMLSSETTLSGPTLGRPPSGRVSPPSAIELAAKRPVQRRVSRLIRPDFLDIHIEEISGDQSQMLNLEKTENTAIDSISSRHIRNKSVELSSGCENGNTSNIDAPKYNRRSLSRSRDLDEKAKVDKTKLADKILQELQILSSMRSKEVDIQDKITNDNISVEKPTTPVKKIKKVKNKEKSTESSTDGDLKTSSTLVKKVKKIVKKSENQTSTPAKKLPGEFPESSHLKPAEVCDIPPVKKLSKLKRPKSYPMKDSVSAGNASEMCTTASEVLETNNISTSEQLTSSPSSFGMADINNTAGAASRESRILRPKSYPSSKLIAPKESKQLISKQITTIEESLASISNQTPDLPLPYSAKLNKNPPTSSQTSEATSLDAKKMQKVTKKNKMSQLNGTNTITPAIPNANTIPGDEAKDTKAVLPLPFTEKIVEKKPNRGLLYAIGLKIEKLRASATSNSCANIPSNKKASLETTSSEGQLKKAPEVKKTKSLCENRNDNLTQLEKKSMKIGNKDRASAEKDGAVGENDSKPVKNEKRSRIDSMIRNLRERSIPRSHRTISSESNYIKRAVSVEEMPGTFNKKSVNKVLGLFKRYEKDASSGNSVRNAHSASNIERELSKQSPIYQNANVFHVLNKKIEKCSSSGTINQDNTNTKPTIKLSKKINENAPAAHQTCPGCLTSPENSQDKRKGLMLELIKPEKFQHSTKTFTNSRLSKRYPCYNDNETFSNISPHNKYIYNTFSNNSKIANAESFTSNNNNLSFIQKSGSCNNSNNNNNNSNNNNINNQCSSLHTSQTSGYRTSSTHEITQNNNLLSPSFENIGNYSSDSRSFQEDCASTSTFLSPTEEVELCFDSWSVCSEDNYRIQRATPSPTVSHLSRASQASSPTRRGDNSEANESVVDRIKRRSFYCRFNEKKPKRTSSIVGPNAVREYYREKSSGSKTKSSKKTTRDRDHSPDITQEFFRPLKLSPIGTELKPPVYRSSFSSSAHDYSASAGRPRKSLNDIRTPTSPSCLSERRHTAYATAENELHNNTSIFASRYKPNTYDETPKTGTTSSSLYSYNTYNPKRRSSFTTNTGTSTVSNTTPQIEGYATLGRRPIRSYDHRTMSLLDSPHPNTYRHESVIPSSAREYTTSLSRSNSRYRKSSTSRSPTNI